MRFLQAASAVALGLVVSVGCGGQTGVGHGDAGGGDGGGDAVVVPPDGGPFIATVHAAPPGKIDLLFMIDNSASMGDKQELLRQAVPDLIDRLVQPNCIDDSNPSNVVVIGPCTPETNGSGNCDCAMGKLEFPPAHDIHIGIVTSSLGGRGSDACAEPQSNPVNPAVDTHNDDRGELINRGDLAPFSGMDQEVPVADASPSNFLAWFPNVPANMGQPTPPVPPIGDALALLHDFQEMVAGVHEYGCGYEAQLESWYRFLIQPDPFDHISRDTGECSGGPPSGTTGNFACLVGVDQTILQQRHDFLRPDSLVAVVVVTDENEETVDPLAIGGQGWGYLDANFPGSPNGQAPRGTSACGGTPTLGPNPGPDSPQCTSCGFGMNASDPNCQNNGGYYTTAEDEPNVRGFHQKQRFGVDPQFPVTRYVNGLTSSMVPDRTGEHTSGGAEYLGNNNCSNPLFSSNLPTSAGSADPSTGQYTALCNLTPGPRTPDLVFFTAITGVPHQLLQVDPSNPDSPQKPSLSASDWTAILGNDPIHYDFTGMDPHMFESETPRQGLPPPAGNTSGSDPENGREWNTNASDLQYACTFPLQTPKDCTSPLHINACDCTMGRCDKCGGPGDTTCSCPPLCDPMVPTTQIRGKAYPAIRELSVARALGGQAIVSSLCPIHPTPANNDNPPDPLYGYRPAMNALLDRLKPAFAALCLPQGLPTDSSGQTSCRILEALPTPGTEAACTGPGLSAPDAATIAAFRAAEKTDPSLPVCELAQLAAGSTAGSSCAASTQPGWCYLTGAAATPCPQSLAFSQGGTPSPGAIVALACP